MAALSAHTIVSLLILAVANTAAGAQIRAPASARAAWHAGIQSLDPDLDAQDQGRTSAGSRSRRRARS